MVGINSTTIAREAEEVITIVKEGEAATEVGLKLRQTMTKETKKLSAPLPPKTSSSNMKTSQEVAKRSKDLIFNKIIRNPMVPEADRDLKMVATREPRIDLPP